MANPAPAGGPPTQAQVDAVLQRLAEIPVKINRMDHSRQEFMANLATRLDAIQQRVNVVAAAMGPVKQAHQELMTTYNTKLFSRRHA